MHGSPNWRAWQCALALAAAASASDPCNARAQMVEEEPEIVVTGTRIPRPDLAAASPIVSFRSEEIAANGALQLEDFLNTLPQVSPIFRAPAIIRVMAWPGSICGAWAPTARSRC